MTGHQHCFDIFRLPQSSHLSPGEVLLNFQSGSHDFMFHDDTIPLYYLPIQLRTYTRNGDPDLVPHVREAGIIVYLP